MQGVMCEAGRMPRGERLKLRSSSDYGCYLRGFRNCFGL